MPMANPIAEEHSQRVVTLARRRIDKKIRREPPLSGLANKNVQHVYADSPDQPARTERVAKRLPPIEDMWRKGQLNDQQYAAGMIFHRAYATVDGKSLGGSMDFERVRGGGLPGMPLAVGFIIAAERLSEAKKWLYARHHKIVEYIVGKELSIIELALYLRAPRRAEREDIGRNLRMALNELADRWLGAHGPKERGRIRAQRNFDPAEATVTTGELIPAPVAHATRKEVKISGGTN